MHLHTQLSKHVYNIEYACIYMYYIYIYTVHAWSWLILHVIMHVSLLCLIFARVVGRALQAESQIGPWSLTPVKSQIQSLLLLSLLFRSISFSLVIPQRKELRYCTGQIHSSENMLLKWPKQRWFIIIDHHWSLLIIIDQLSLDVNLVGSASSESGSYKPNRYSCGGFSASPARGPECCEHWGQVARRATGCYRCERSQT